MLRKVKVTLLYWMMGKFGNKIDLRKLEPAPSFFNKLLNILSKPFIDRNAINRIILGPISAKLMQSGYNIGLFHYLAKSPGATIDEISSQLNIEAYPAGILLDGLEALKLVQKVGPSRYYNTLHSMLLAQDFNDKLLSKLMNYVQNVLTPAMAGLDEAVVSNKPAGMYKIFGNDAKDYYCELSKNDKYNQYFVPFMSTFSLINIDAVAESRFFSDVNRLIDIGGNVGDLAVSIAKRHPAINITVFDHPLTAETASQRFKANDHKARLNAVGGDFLTDDLPDGYDGMLFSHVIDIFDAETNKKLFQKAFNKLPSNGKIFIYTPVVHGDHDNSFTYKIYNTYFLCLANGKGKFYPPKMIIDWVKETGFSNVQLQHLPCNEILITGTKPSVVRSAHGREDSTAPNKIPIFS